MPDAIKRHKPPMLRQAAPTLLRKQQANGRTLALNGAAWRRLRSTVLSEQPLCPRCKDEGYIVPAVDVDHDDNDPSNNDRRNLIGLCHAHHSAKTHQDMGHRTAVGCDVHGRPLPRLLEESPATKAHEPSASNRAHRRS